MLKERVKKTYETNGKTFTIVAELGHGGYVGRWICNTCQETGTSNVLSQTVDDAWVKAIYRLGPHARRCS